MSANTSIEWTDRTWNPVTGCTKVSPGCAHCYAEGVAARFWGTQYPPVEYTYHDPTICSQVRDLRPREFTDLQCHEDRLLAPLSWRKPQMVFVNSMSDLFHEDVPDKFIDRVFAVMALAGRHTFQVLTKRPQRMRDYLLTLTGSVERMDDLEYAAVELGDSTCAAGACEDRGWPLPNVWLGVSVENQQFADDRIPLLLQTPAAVRFISAEPLLGPVTLKPRWLCCPECKGSGTHDCQNDPLVAVGEPGPCPWPDHLDWVIVGGESGQKARPCDLAWARSLVQQCQAAGVPVFVKQFGARPYVDQEMEAGQYREAIDLPGYELVLKDRKGGDMAEWPVDLRVRESGPGI